MNSLTQTQRDHLRQLASTLLPGSDSQPAAADIGIETAAIDRALKSRPDLFTGFCDILDRFHGDPATFLGQLDDQDYDILATLVCAAWVMDETVQKALGYFGQQALSPHRGGFGCEELVMDMLEQEKRYRDA